MWIVYELLCCAFLILSGSFIWGWVFARQRLPWKGRQWLKWSMLVLASFIGSWHLIFGILKVFYLVWGLVI